MESSQRNLDGSNGYLIDRQQLLMAMDQWVEILSQPAYTISELNSLKCVYPPKAPMTIWDLPGNQSLPIPEGYRICLMQTSLTESKINEFTSTDKVKEPMPGIYILYALPW